LERRNSQSLISDRGRPDRARLQFGTICRRIVEAGQSVSRKRVLNPEKIIPETPGIESPDVFAPMGTTFKTSGEQLHIAAMIIALIVACATNLTLLCWWTPEIETVSGDQVRPTMHDRSNGRILSSNPFRSASLAEAVYSLPELVGNLSPVAAAISHLNSGLQIGRACSFFSEWPIYLRSSGLCGFGTVLRI
jgi:hypothetical protein